MKIRDVPDGGWFWHDGEMKRRALCDHTRDRIKLVWVTASGVRVHYMHPDTDVSDRHTPPGEEQA